MCCCSFSIPSLGISALTLLPASMFFLWVRCCRPCAVTSTAASNNACRLPCRLKAAVLQKRFDRDLEYAWKVEYIKRQAKVKEAEEEVGGVSICS